MRSKIQQCILFLSLSAASIYSVNANPLISKLDDFTAHYNIVHDGDIVGKGKRQLTHLDDGSIDFSYQTEIEWFIFEDQREEFTNVRIINDTVIPNSYKSTRKGTGKDKFYHWQYNAEQQSITNLKKKSSKPTLIKWPEGLQSKLSYHLQTRLNLINGVNDFDFEVINTSGKIKTYHYEYVGKEEIMLPFGVINTVKLQRKKINSEQVTYVWLAPELDFAMVKLHQIDGSLKQFHAELYDFNGSQSLAEYKNQSK
ncbi:DUF3108 domain-containing protein [Thalassotalea aquiviva]|uniref:DUF3108 domain-containing protein n=1 Tax=Thalassotalea aquiviva TaxID=3242415 RepID=UPI00352B6BD7